MKKKITKKELSAIHRERAHKFWEDQNLKRAKKLAVGFEKTIANAIANGNSPKEIAVEVCAHFLKNFRSIVRK